ncbi:hypothetical protein [Paraburkholderia sp.]|uniref:hypothetical protein n=1 Tax=Paraburkholderia sp. TaxID=1926495 RepID=UPI002580DC02|nr:hypothetical protein [Paraburkholderia sp.]
MTGGFIRACSYIRFPRGIPKVLRTPESLFKLVRGVKAPVFAKWSANKLNTNWQARTDMY